MNTDSKVVRSILAGPWIYFAVAYGWTWLFWGLAALSGISLNNPYGVILLMLGLCGPAIAGIGLTYLTHDKTGVRDYWHRVTDVRRIGVRWYCVIFLLFPAISVLAASLAILSGGSGVVYGKAVEQLALIPMIITLFLPAFMEELGWRGYALDRLQSRWNALVSSLVLGILWAFWHTPLFFFKDSIQYTMGFGSVSFWTFITGTVLITIFLTWIFNNTHRSTLSAILWHATANGTAAIFTLTPLAYNYSVLLWLIVAIAIILVAGPKTFSRRDQTPLYPQS